MVYCNFEILKYFKYLRNIVSEFARFPGLWSIAFRKFESKNSRFKILWHLLTKVYIRGEDKIEISVLVHLYNGLH